MSEYNFRSLIGLLLFFTLPISSFAQTSVDWPAITQKPFAALKVSDLGLSPLLTNSDDPKSAKLGWAKKRQEIHSAWQAKLGPFPKRPADLEVRIEKTEKIDGYTRQLLSFLSAEGDRIHAYLLVPGDIKENEKRPAMVVLHQTTNETLKEPAGLGKNPTLALGVHLVKRGYVVLCPECYIMKEGGPRKQADAVGTKWPGLTGLGKMTFDASRCIDFLVSLGYVDASRIGCIGHSLGAKEVLYALAFEPRYQVGVFNEGGIGIRMSNWTDPWYLTNAMKAHIPAFEHHQILALCAPRPILILGGDSADGDASWPFVKATLPIYDLLGASDRIGLVNHRAKHTYPTEARRISYQWLDHWLKHRPTQNEVGP